MIVILSYFGRFSNILVGKRFSLHSFILGFFVLPLAWGEVIPKDAALTQVYEKVITSNSSPPSTFNSKDNSKRIFLEKPKNLRPWLHSPTHPRSHVLEDELEPPHYIRQYLYSLNRWERVPQFMDLSKLWEYDPNQVAGEVEQDGFDLPLNSNLKITGHKSVTVELNKTHYFGQTDRYSFYGMNSGYSNITLA